MNQAENLQLEIIRFLNLVKSSNTRDKVDIIMIIRLSPSRHKPAWLKEEQVIFTKSGFL